MKRSGKVKWGNLRVGIIVTIAIAVMLYSSFRGGGTSIFESKNTAIAYFQNVNGLVKGAPVWLAGVEVGNVRSVKFVNISETKRIKAVLTIKKSVWEFVTMDTKVRLGTIGFLGDKYVEILPGSKNLPVMEPGNEIPVDEGVGLDAITAKAPAMASSVDSLLSNMKEISGMIARGEGTAGKIISDTNLYANLVNALDDATEIMANIKKNQQEIMSKLESTLDGTDKIAARLNSGDGTIGKLLTQEELYNNLNSSSGNLDSILTKLDRGEGSAGALLNDAELYEEVRNLVVRINNLIADIEENPRKYFKFSVF
jgi:phospholipid/cholesterol/gamma-HCH transport system substrate-binding protein